MAVKVTGQFEQAGDFSIVDGKDVSGNITGSNVSASGTITANTFVGDGSSLTGVVSGADISGSWLGQNVLSGSALEGTRTVISGSAISTGSFGTIRVGPTSGYGAASGIAFGDGDTAIYEQSNDVLNVKIGTQTKWQFNGDNILSPGTNKAQISPDNGVTSPTFIPGRSHTDTGYGSNGGKMLSLIAGGASILQVSSSGTISGSSTSTASFGRIEATTISASRVDVDAGTLAIGGTELGKTVADNITNLDQQLNKSSSPTFANLTTTGDITAQNFIVSSSVTYMTQSFRSGSTIFGDSQDDTHRFTGSLLVTSSALTIDSSGTVSGSATSTGSFGKGKISSGIIEGKGSSNTYIELDGSGYPNDNFRVYIAGQKSLHIDNNAGGVMMGYAASATGDSVAIGFGASSAASTVAIGRGISSSAGEIRIGESGNTDAYLAQGNATLHVAGVVVSGSTSITGDLTVTGSISGSASSTGSFGRVDGVDSIRTSKLRLSKDTTEASDTTLSIENFGGGNKLTIVNGATSLIYEGRAGQSVAGLYFNVTSTAMLGNLASSATVPAFKFNGDTDTGLGRADSDQLSLITGGTEAFRVTSTLISGSAVSTGSFGRVFSTGVVSASAFIGDGSGITGLTSAAISSYTNSGNNRIVTSVDSSTVNSEANLTFDGSTLDVTGDIVVSGDLTINGTTTTLAATNLEIADAFGFFATGSAGANVDAGIIVQSGSYVDSGSAIYHDISSERWSVAKGVGSSEVSVSNKQWQGFVATVYTASASPVGSSAKYGVGEIHIDDDGEIYIYS